MSATYNWAYKPGVVNKYGLTVPAGADNAKPSGWTYVALFGNDATGNGSRIYPYKTLTRAFASASSNDKIVLGSGVYRELGGVVMPSNFFDVTIVGDGDVTIDISYLGYFTNSPLGVAYLYNFTLLGNGTSVFTTAQYLGFVEDVIFSGSWYAAGVSDTQIKRCIVSNFAGQLQILNNNYSAGYVNNCTFFNCNNIQFVRSVILVDSSLFVNCNFSCSSHITYSTTRYCLFYHCNFKLTDGVATGGALYPSVPAGYTYYSTISALQAAYLALYSTQSFKGCTIDDPLFNNQGIGDYTLSFGSPAKNLSYFGTFVGARSIAQSLKIRAVEADGDFDFSSAVNVTIADNSITLTDPSLDALIETKVIENTLGRQLKSIPIVGFNADRNGQYIDSIADLSTVTKAAGDVLPIPASYIVENGAITYNSAIYTAGQRFTTVVGQTTFTTTTGGVLREILEAPQRHTIEMKLGDVQPFTTEAFNHFEPGITPTTNNVGDSRTGAILRGNGDPAFVRGSAVEFPVNSRYIKIRFTIRANNLKP